MTGRCSIRDSVPIDVRVPLNGICADGGGEVEWGHCAEQSSHGGGGLCIGGGHVFGGMDDGWEESVINSWGSEQAKQSEGCEWDSFEMRGVPVVMGFEAL